MTRRKIVIVALVAFLIGLVVFLPLRVAIDATMHDDSPLTAKQVGGSVWNGRIGGLGLRGQPLGTFSVALKPLPLLIGRVELDAQRLDADQGPLSMKLVTGGGKEGVIDAEGRVDVARLFAPVPVETLMLEKVTVLFDDGACAKAEGTIQAIPSLRLPLGIDAIDGTLRCGEDGRAVAEMASGRGGHRFLLNIDAEGGIEAEARTRNAPPALAAAMQTLGFGVEGDELVLRRTVR